MTINDAVASRILELLVQKKITQYRLEQESGIPHGAMGRILNGQNKTVTLSTIYKLARGFDREFVDSPVFDGEDLEID